MFAIVKLATTAADYTIKFKNGDIIADHANFDGKLSDAAIRKQLKSKYPDAKSVFVGATSYSVDKYRMNAADVRERGERISD